jgi:hypothetical protein
MSPKTFARAGSLVRSPLRVTRSIVGDEKTLSIAALSQTFSDRLGEHVPASPLVNFWNESLVYWLS